MKALKSLLLLIILNNSAFSQNNQESIPLNGYYVLFNTNKQKSHVGVYKGNRFMDGRSYIYDGDKNLKAIRVYKNGEYIGDLTKSITADTVNQRFLKQELFYIKSQLEQEKAKMKTLQEGKKGEGSKESIAHQEKMIKILEDEIIEMEKQIK